MSGLPERLGPSACPSPACSPFPACHQPAHILTSRRGSGCVAASRDWLSRPAAWIPVPGARHQQVLSGIVRECRPAGNLVPDAHLAALALEHGLTVVSTDTDFAKYPGVTWLNPVSATALGLPRRPGMLNRGLSGQHTSNPGPGPEASNTCPLPPSPLTLPLPFSFLPFSLRPAGHDSQVSAVVPSIAHPGIRPVPIMEPASFDLAAAADGSSGQRAGQVRSAHWQVAGPLLVLACRGGPGRGCWLSRTVTH